MKEDIKNLWTAALRSGKYKQGQKALKQGDKFCCLGVLCDISGLDEWTRLPETTKDRDKYMYEMSYLPRPVLKWAGFIPGNETGEFIGEKIVLSEMNDILEYSFEEIADVIDKHWEKL
jgi:hypothetical protein